MDIQRGKLVGQNGPGSLYIDTDGSNYIISAADKWYDKRIRNNDFIDVEEFIIEDKRLSDKLGNKNFRLVPDFRTSVNKREKKNNAYLTIPVQRFPRVEYCQKCGYLTTAEKGKNKKWSYCESCKKDRVFLQFPIVTVCEKGHIEDFPYFEFVHGEGRNSKNEDHTVSLKRTGSSILNWKVECTCGKSHSLRGITGRINTSEEESLETPFQKEMRKVTGRAYKCSGLKPWTGDYEKKEECDFQPHALLKNSLSLYRPETIKSLSITSSTNSEELEHSLDGLYNEEFNKLALLEEEEDRDKLKISNSFHVDDDNSVIKAVNYIHRLQELVVQTNFHRLNPSDEQISFNNARKNSEQSMLFSDEAEYTNWYPAKKMYGEGIFIEFNNKVLNDWEKQLDVMSHFNKVKNRTEKFYLSDRFESPSTVLIHTLSHTLMKELSKHCGYPLTSLNEKLYLGENKKGILIYVTDSDSAGTYGGLVRLAEKGKFDKIFNQSLRNVEWCSSDPICREFGQTVGQGLNQSNGSSCHNCSYVPDITCSNRNCFLDREYIMPEENSSNNPSVSITNYYKWY